MSKLGITYYNRLNYSKIGCILSCNEVTLSLEKTTNSNLLKTGSYLFCVGFDLLGGTLLKLDFSFLYGCFSFSCNFSKDCEGTSVAEVDSRLSSIRNLAASAPSMLECRISTNARSKEAITLRLDFIT